MSDEKDSGADAAAVVSAGSIDTPSASHADYVYSVYESWGGELCIGVATVIRRGKTLLLDYDTDSGRAFGYRTRVDPDKYATTPDGAVEKYREYLKQEIAQAEVTIMRCQKMIAMAPKPLFATATVPLSEASGSVPSEAPKV